MLSHEIELKETGYCRIAGIDEAGRGPLAGPVVAAAVILPARDIDGIRDSKKLSEAQREKVFQELLLHAEIGVGIVSSQVIDDINIYKSAKLAMVLAVQDLLRAPDFLLIDGKNMELALPLGQRSIIRGESASRSIAAASIVAKVTRDRLMHRFDRLYPEYDFARHKGYPTPEHVARLEIHGPSQIHRFSFHPVSQMRVNRSGGKTGRELAAGSRLQATEGDRQPEVFGLSQVVATVNV